MSDELTTPRPPDSDSGEHDPHPEPRGRLPIGTPPRFGRYETWRVLGSGQFGLVCLAHDSLMQRYVAIKAPKEQLPPDKHAAFLREARVIADIHHPNICPVYDVGVQDDLPFIVMRYLSGGTLGDLIARNPPTPTQVLRFAGQIANGLEAAHAGGVIHRDLKPANVLYDEKAGKLLLTDFGVARWADATRTLGGTPGTPYFMAPEQWGPGGPFGPITARTDVYCLGVMLFQLLTGARLFDGTIFELMAHHCQTPPRKPSAVNPLLGTRFDDLILKALAKQPAERYASAREFANAIAECLRTPPQPREQKWQITVPGTWYSRPAGNTDAKWQKVAETPAEVVTRPGEVYQLSASSDVQDAALAGLTHLKSLTALQTLNLTNCKQITDAGLTHLKSLTALQTLNLTNCKITDAGLTHLKSLTALQTLNLWYCEQITDAGLTHLKSLTALQTLDLTDCEQITDAGLTHLKSLTALQTLYLWYCRQITDAGLTHLKSLTALQTLNLGHCNQITDAGLAHLKSLTALQWLNLSGCKITDAGLTHLKSLTALQTLYLWYCRQITDAGVAELQRALPNCKIAH